MNIQQKQLLLILSNKLFDKDCDIEPTEHIIIEAKQQTVSCLIMPNDYKNLANNIRVDYAHAELTELLKGIPFVTIKGYASAYYYPDPSKRSMGDVDFYVEPENYQKAKEALLNNGLEQVEQDHERHETFRKNGVLYELHSEIKGVPNGRDGIRTTSKNAEEKVRICLSDLVRTAITVSTEQGNVIIPDAFHHGLIMLLHISRHMLNGEGIGLRHLCDWAVYAGIVNVENYKQQLQELGLWTFACQLTALCSKYLGLPEKRWSGKWDELFLTDLIEDIMNAGNFGRKDTGRAAGLCMNREHSIIASLAQMTRKRFKFFDNHPIFLPVGIIVYAVIYFGERVTGKKQWVRIDNVIQGAKRQRLYEQFKLFI